MAHRPFNTKPVRRGQPLISRPIPATDSGFVRVGIPRFRYQSERVAIDASNSEIVFEETAGVKLLARVARGTWFWGQIAAYIKDALEDAGASTYTVTYSQHTHQFTITSDGSGGGGIFRLFPGLAAYDFLPVAGFTTTKTGALTYTGDAEARVWTAFNATQPIIGPQSNVAVEKAVTKMENGARAAAVHGEEFRYTFRLEFETAATILSLDTLFRGTAEFEKPFQLYPHYPYSPYFDAIWDTDGYRPVEMTDRQLFNVWTIDFSLVFAVPNSGVIQPEWLLDRRDFRS